MSLSKSEDVQFENFYKFSDEELTRQITAGSQDALAILFDRYRRLVFDVALRIVRDPGEAEDVVQNVFLDVFRAMANFDPRKGILKVWILQYALSPGSTQKAAPCFEPLLSLFPTKKTSSFRLRRIRWARQTTILGRD